ncbi:MAG TPA: SDR family NAD(P)-dependent oxidoreductase, partial [Lachnospiraceae bacterium]|nr:SDR family NAD(P)-dependent oxidoreductase [Lachnospiraceae bacterium]
MLTGKIALVTGASRGIGKEIAKTLADAGAYVYVNYNGSKQAAEETVLEIEKSGGRAEAIGCSVADFDAVKQMLGRIVEKQGRIDILVNNAGITKDNLLMKMSEKEFEQVLAVNLKGAFHTIRHASRYFLKQKSGRIINISSVS